MMHVPSSAAPAASSLRQALLPPAPCLPAWLQGLEQFSRECDQPEFKAAIAEVERYRAGGEAVQLPRLILRERESAGRGRRGGGRSLETVVPPSQRPALPLGSGASPAWYSPCG